MSEYLDFLVAFAVESEFFLKLCYSSIRNSPPYNFFLFYIMFFYILYKFFGFFKSEKVLTYKIIDESEEGAINQAISKNNSEILESLNAFHQSQNSEKKPNFEKKLENASKELAHIQSLYTEFQEEILDSHKSIIDSIKLPYMK